MIITNIEENCNKKSSLTCNFLLISDANTHIFSTIYPQTYAQNQYRPAVLLQSPPDVVERRALPTQAGLGPIRRRRVGSHHAARAVAAGADGMSARGPRR
jgi:hypothetical protein